MNLFYAVVLGFIEGITEFLPISSTAHLLISGKLLNIYQTEFQSFFDIFIQSGAILSVIFLYFQYVLKNKQLWTKVLISFIPTAVVGLILEKIIKKYFFNSLPLIIFAMFSIGVAFILFEYFVKKGKLKLVKSIAKMSNREAFLIGIGQSLAVIPGISRAGIVMLGMMGMRFKRDESALYSFLLAVPTILAASGLEVLKTDVRIISGGNNLVILTVGFLMSFATSYFVIRWFIDYLKKYSLTVFGIYRIILSIVLFVL